MLQIGTKIKFAGEKQRYTVQAASERYAVCTKPFNAKRTVIYTIIDFYSDVRGPDNMVFGDSYETKGQCKSNLARLEAGRMEVSWRNRIPLRVEKFFVSPKTAERPTNSRTITGK